MLTFRNRIVTFGDSRNEEMDGLLLNRSLKYLDGDGREASFSFTECDVRKDRAFVMLVYFFACASLLYIYNKVWKTKKWHGKEERLKSVSEMVTLRQFSFRMPAIVEGLLMLYKIQKDGTRAMERFWRSTNYSPLFRVPMPINHKIVCVMEPELIRKCLGSGDVRTFNKPKFLYDIIFTDWMSSGLLTSNGEIWHTHRKALNRYFSAKSLPSHLKIFNKAGRELLDVLNENGNEIIGEKGLFPLLYDQFLKVILEVLLGRRNVSRKETSTFFQVFRKIKSLVVYRCYHPMNNLRFIWWLNPVRKVHDECIAFIRNYIYKGIDDAVEDVEGESDSSGFKSCLHHLLQSNIQKDQIPDQIATLLITGHESMDTTVHFLLQHLAEHPHIQRKCQEEIDAIFNMKGEDTELTCEDLAELKYLERCILETLRLTTTVPLFFRHLSDSMELGGYHLEKDTMLVFSSWLVHKNPEIYPDPEKFDPDRFLPEVVKERHPYAFFPFALGPRICIGWEFGMMEMKIFISYLLSKYTIHTRSKLSEVKVLYEVTAYPEKSYGIYLTRKN